MMNRIYLDHAATTPTAPEVLAAMLPYFSECWGNASAVYATGREARRAVENARKEVAKAIGALPQEICFTSGGSESDNTAIRGTARALREKGKHIITTAIEHHAVLKTCRQLEQEGFVVTRVRPDGEGRIDPEEIRKAIRKDTILVTVMAANNEIGTLEPVGEIGRICREQGVVFHTDAVQAAGAVAIDVREAGCDLLSLSGHKFYGPKGIGALYIHEGTRLDPLIAGGQQERGFRAGTENLPGIVGLGKAITLAAENLDRNAGHMRRMRDRLTDGLLASVPGAALNGPREERLPNNCSIRFDGIDGEALLLRLDLAGIAASAGSACTAGNQETSHVLKAIGLTEEEAGSSLRLTTGIHTTEEEVDETIRTVREIVADLRRMFRR
ncbi:MAG: cysteine desulfurase NifS [Clostridia bacterium]|nr:cysteine desulfurase NifS [Clostridia bacterium]